MPFRYDIVHTTVYRYRQPVTFGEHRVMFRPRDSHDLRVLATDLDVSPEADVRMIRTRSPTRWRWSSRCRRPTPCRSSAASRSSMRTR
jgi:hypothetical protein